VYFPTDVINMKGGGHLGDLGGDGMIILFIYNLFNDAFFSNSDNIASNEGIINE
jgi:hypothetical protein